MDHVENNYGKKYYDSHLTQDGDVAYEHNEEWDAVFVSYAENIIDRIHPKTVLDVGCAKGFLVEALCDRGVDAFGIDSSEYAISCVREELKERCIVQSIVESIDKKYDLVTCIEVLEHLDPADISVAIKNLCNMSDDIIFSSSPFDYGEDSHISVHPVEFWAEQFAYHGFYHDVNFDCSFIAVQAMRFRKCKKTNAELVRNYENALFQKHQEIVATRHNYQITSEQVNIYKDAYQKHVDMINEELNPKILELEADICKLKNENRLLYEERQNFENLQNLFDEKIKREVNLRKVYEMRAKECDIYERLAAHHQFEYQKAMVRLTCLEKGLTFKELVKRWIPGYENRVKKSQSKKIEQLLAKPYEYWEPVFDAEFYAEYYPDLLSALGTNKKELLNHFICYGMNEGRKGCDQFDVAKYMMYNNDLVAVFGENIIEYYLHYIDHGIKEKRICY